MVLGVKNLPANAGDLGDSSSILGQGTALGGGNGTPLQYSCWGIPWTEEIGGLQSMGSQRIGHNRLSILTDFGRREKEGRDESGKESRSGRKDEGGDDTERTPRQDVSRNYTTCHFHSLRNQTVCGQLYLSKAGRGRGWLCVFVICGVRMCVSVFVSVCMLECVCVWRYLNMYLCVHIPACLDKSVCVDGFSVI